MKRIFASLAALGVTTGLLASVATAHAEFASSTPAPGSVVATAPTSVVINFTEDLAPGSTGFVTNGSGATVSTGATISTIVRTQMTIGLKANLPAGSYFVSWHSISADDGDVLDGSFGFSIAPVAATAPKVPATLPNTATLPAQDRAGIALGVLALAALLAAGSTPALRRKSKA